MFPLHWHRPLMLLVLAAAALTLVAIVGSFLDDRILTGLPIWVKAAKFALSVLVYALTWAWLIRQFTRWHRIAWWAGTVAAGGLGIELIVIVIQIVRGTTSHFNFTTPLNAALWDTMGLSIIVVWLATVVAALALLRNDGPDPARNAAIRYGVGLSLVGAALGMLMVLPTKTQLDTDSAILGAHTVGVPDGGPGLPILGWSTVGGDLRVPHFIGMHAVQLLPLLLMALELAARRIPALSPASVRAALVTTAAASYTAGLALLTWQALRGQALIHPDKLTLSAAGAIAIATTAAVVVIIRRRPIVEPTAPEASRTTIGAQG